ncbi:uncharacterized protein CC84DRAFT_1181574 [Paraphaeosphaeria sporulosa]|uniref:F-box domain-containing protein n=1 Tax=Paraphaeosphaeria sporulosa TaxID=1460663 RepID=A0A177BYH2_9PLEO|nr:uncharacterized protein CC84DRAFT_1181574 [Paraphaeosphaeria sporulosa]OAF99466.1 hypothetical protein CC84DRAFT_1181574 [Paraphaeosphaeria sporulosa]
MHLPPEIHDEILRYLDRQDIGIYRLVGRSFATAGTPQLFERLHFRTSLESLQRLAHISKRDCGGHVKHLLWNTTGAEFEARAFMEGLRTRELKYILGRLSLDTPTRTVTAVGEQVDLSPSLGAFLLAAIFSGFPNLKSLYVLTLRTSPSAYGSDGWVQREFDATSDPWPAAWKATHGCPRCQGLCQAVVSTGSYEMQVGALAAHATGHPLTALRVEHLYPAGVVVTGYEKALAHITSLDLVLGMRKKDVGSVQRMLRATPHLRVLKLWLNSGSYWADVDHDTPLPNLADMLLGQDSLTELRELEVHQFDVAPAFLEAFLLSHARTLRVLKMHRMKLYPRGSWIALFGLLKGKLALEVGWVRRKLGYG